MKISVFFTLAFSFTLLFACDKNDDPAIAEFDYLIFGHFYGECFGEACVETFKLTPDKLYEDQNDNYNGNDFDFIELGNEKYEIISDLTEFVPDQLLEESESEYGCPDCADQGGLRITYSENGAVVSLRLDQQKSEVPEYLHEFMDKVNEKIALINQ